ncbi:glycosyltransferase family 9 protein [Pasteurellaceae bacterium LIM206]|nr:glycosyltransferase family 9 protein [Pasteurellaceae bacterium LIM206]
MKKILVIRNDKLGDFMLIWPALALLKKSLPDTEITALVPAYTAPLSGICPYIDKVIIDAKPQDKTEFQRVLNEIKEQRFNAVISFFSSWHNAKLTWRAGIPYRLAPATKLFQFLHNHRLTQRRSRSEKAEFEYNLDLARYFVIQRQAAVREPQLPYLRLEQSAVQNQRVLLSRQLGLNPGKKWLFVHSGTGGSANNLRPEQYAQLITAILAEFDCQIVLTAGPNESEKAHALADLVNHPNVAVYDKNNGLVDFTHSLACADLFMAGSTGPLHICGALNVPTIGFYPAHRSAIPRRWRPINAAERHLAFCPPEGNKEQMKNVSNINIPQAMQSIIPFIHRQWD